MKMISDTEVLDLRVLVTAEPFGFGPSAAAAHFFPHLRKRVKTLSFAGIGHTLDIQKKLGYDAILDCGSKEDQYKNLQTILKDYDVLFTSCDLEAARVGISAGVKVAIYDPLAWYWKTIPDSCKEADIYICQDFFGVKERLKALDLPRATVVPPIIDSANFDRGTLRSIGLVNFGGLKNPFLENSVCNEYAALILAVVDPTFKATYSETKYITSEESALYLRGKGYDVWTVSPVNAQIYLSKSDVAFMTPG